MRFLVAHNPEHLRQQAAASSERWRHGRPLSPLDGVPFAGGDSVQVQRHPGGLHASTRQAGGQPEAKACVRAGRQADRQAGSRWPCAPTPL